MAKIKKGEVEHASRGDAPSQVGRRERMVRSQLRNRGIGDPRVLDAFGRVPRHDIVPNRFQGQAYDDHPLPIGFGQTISQPYVVAYMIQTLQLKQTDRVLEIGTGCGYQTSLLAELAGPVYSLELLPELADRARRVVESLGYGRIHIKNGNGMVGWRECAPFDATSGRRPPLKFHQRCSNNLLRMAG